MARTPKPIRRIISKKPRFSVCIKKRFPATATFLAEADRALLYKAVCLFERIDLTGWTDEAIADSAAHAHRHQYHHPVNVLEHH
jgi:hypothetical protein